eukprot:SAG31_NODE_44_length_31168_cov_16.507290_2_plen_377_part_00
MAMQRRQRHATQLGAAAEKSSRVSRGSHHHFSSAPRPSTLQSQYVALYDALRNGTADESRFLRLLSKSPRAAHYRDPAADGLSLLHWAAYFGASERVVAALCAADPTAAAYASDKDGSLPLHVAAWTGCSIGTIACIYSTNPAAIGLSDGWGQLPVWKAAAAQHHHLVPLLTPPSEKIESRRDNMSDGQSAAAKGRRDAFAEDEDPLWVREPRRRVPTAATKGLPVGSYSGLPPRPNLDAIKASVRKKNHSAVSSLRNNSADNAATESIISAAGKSNVQQTKFSTRFSDSDAREVTDGSMASSCGQIAVGWQSPPIQTPRSNTRSTTRENRASVPTENVLDGTSRSSSGFGETSPSSARAHDCTRPSHVPDCRLPW